MWPRVFETGWRSRLRYQSFPWTNQARGNAGVTCVIVGLVGRSANSRRTLSTSTGTTRHVSRDQSLSDRGTASSDRQLRDETPLPGLPPMVFGSMPRDGGHLILTPTEARRALAHESPEAERFIRRYRRSRGSSSTGMALRAFGSRMTTCDAAMQIPADRRAPRTRASVPRDQQHGSEHAEMRRPSRTGSAIEPTRTRPAIIVPSVSSERREYIPMGFVGRQTPSFRTLANAVYDAEPWLFGLLQSRMHMAWVGAVGGRMKTDYRYSAALVYNTFPVPELTDEDKACLTLGRASRVLGAREQFSDQTLAELYDPDEDARRACARPTTAR